MLFAGSAQAAEVLQLDERARARQLPPPHISTWLLDPATSTRFHLTITAGFADGEDSFGDGSTLILEPVLLGAVGDHVALGFALPVGVDSAEGGGSEQGFLGNLRLSGVAGNHYILDREGLRLDVGIGLDVYVPTRTAPDEACELRSICRGHARARRIHAYEAESFIVDALIARPRIQVALDFRGLRGAAELGVAPGFYVRGPREAEMFVRYGAAGRISYDIGAFRPYFEVGFSGTLDHPSLLGGLGDRVLGGFDPSDARAQLALGVRGFFEEFAPATAVLLDVDTTTVFFAFDLAGVLRRGFGRAKRREPGFPFE